MSGTQPTLNRLSCVLFVCAFTKVCVRLLTEPNCGTNSGSDWRSLLYCCSTLSHRVNVLCIPSPFCLPQELLHSFIASNDLLLNSVYIFMNSNKLLLQLISIVFNYYPNKQLWKSVSSKSFFSFVQFFALNSLIIINNSLFVKMFLSIFLRWNVKPILIINHRFVWNSFEFKM